MKSLSSHVALVTGASRGVGKGIALALATAPNLMEKSGQVFVAAELGLEYGFTDIDGRQPIPLTLQTS